MVVTGLGATTPLGGDVASTWAAMLAGQSGVKVLTEDWVDMLPVHIAAPVAVDPSEVLPRPLIKRSDRSGQFAIIAAREAWADAGSPELEPERLGVVHRLRHRRRHDAARRVRHAQGDAAPAGCCR